MRNRLVTIYCLSACFAASALVFLLGCGEDAATPVTCQGRVLLDGEPLTAGRILVIPDKGPRASGIVQPDGSFTLTTFKPGDGVVAGSHAVALISVAGKELEETPPSAKIPMRYSSVATSGLTVDVSKVKTNLLINLSRRSGNR